jgi:hypothetical protein
MEFVMHAFWMIVWVVLLISCLSNTVYIVGGFFNKWSVNACAGVWSLFLIAGLWLAYAGMVFSL